MNFYLKILDEQLYYCIIINYCCHFNIIILLLLYMIRYHYYIMRHIMTFFQSPFHFFIR